MLRWIWTKTLRDFFVAIVGWGLGLAVLYALVYVTFTGSASTAASRASIVQLAGSFRFAAEPIAITTPDGFASWKIGAFLPVLLSIWTVLAGARMIRGEEERGTLDVLLAQPQSRLHILLEKVAGWCVALAAIAVLIALGILVGQAAADVPLSPGGALLAGGDAVLVAFVFGALTVLLSQLMRSQRAALGWGYSLVAIAYVLDGTGRVVPNAHLVQYLSPFFYGELSKPLIVSYGTNPGAFGVLIALGTLLVSVAALLFVRRDLGSVAFPSWARRSAMRANLRSISLLKRRDLAVTSAQRAFSTRGIVPHALASQAGTTLWWVVGVAAYSAWGTSIARSSERSLAQIATSSPVLAQLFGGQSLSTNAGFLSVALFFYMPAAIALFALTLALAWANNLARNQLELVFATPRARWQIYLAHYLTLVVAVVLALGAIWLATRAATSATGLRISASAVAAATWGMLPLALLTGGLIFALSAWLRPSAILAITGALLALSFFAAVLAPLLHLPGWLLGLSMFYQYGSPITGTTRPIGLLCLCGIAGALVAAGSWRISHADLAR